MPSKLPFLVPAHIKQRLQELKQQGDLESSSALERQLFPSQDENIVLTNETPDPLGASRYFAAPRLIHQYKNRCLLLTTSHCLGYCRYCFRRSTAGTGFGFISEDELEQAMRYLHEHSEVEELLLSGGDILTGSMRSIEWLVGSLRKQFPNLLLRFCTRANVFAPDLFTAELVSFLKSQRPLWLIPHINHPAELSDKALHSLQLCLDSGIPVQSQTVLLSGVNDSLPVLKKLFHQLTLIGVKPGYLFQSDLAQGISHFRLPIDQAVSLYRQLQQELSGLSTPVFALDLPDGGGKFNLLQLPQANPDIKIEKTADSYVFTRDGLSSSYPLK